MNANKKGLYSIVITVGVVLLIVGVSSVFSYGSSGTDGTVTANTLAHSANQEGGGEEPCEECYADCNQDGTVNNEDLVIMKSEFLKRDCAATPCRADSNGDGKVDLFDLKILNSELSRKDCCL